jgi:hypothetical protein
MACQAQKRDPLVELAKRITHEHAQVTACFRKGVDHALRAGELLEQAKAECGHGSWMAWLELNCPSVSVRQAQRYLRLWVNRKCVPKDAFDQGLNAALDSIAERQNVHVKVQTSDDTNVTRRVLPGTPPMAYQVTYPKPAPARSISPEELQAAQIQDVARPA